MYYLRRDKGKFVFCSQGYKFGGGVPLSMNFYPMSKVDDALQPWFCYYNFLKKTMEWTDRNFDQSIRGSDDIVYNGIVAVQKVSNNTLDGQNCKYPYSKCPQNF